MKLEEKMPECRENREMLSSYDFIEPLNTLAE